MELNYLNLLQSILENGEHRMDRTGVGTISLFAPNQLRFDLTKGFPAITSKKLAWKSMLSELLWFIKGSGDERLLCEILHGSRDESLSTIWTDNANALYWKSKSKFNGDLGRVYGVQWRSWRGVKSENDGYSVFEVDQLKTVIEQIKNDPTNRRIILSAWNPGELNQMALPPCHVFCQFYVSGENLSLQMYQRSADMFLGVPFNIASYATLLHMVAAVTNKKAKDLVMVFGDAHIYSNHVDQVKEQLSRRNDLYDLPTIEINPNVKDIDSFTMNDIKLINYKSHPTIKAPMAV